MPKAQGYRSCNDTMSAHPLIACHECDLLHRVRPLPASGVARCSRCGAELYREHKNSLDRTLALAVAAAVLFAIANSFPFMAFKLEAQVQQTLLSTGIIDLYEQGMWQVALVVFLTSILFPSVQIAGLLYVLLPLRFGRVVPGAAMVFRVVHDLQPWAMMEVYMLGVLVSYVKLAKMAEIVLGPALISFAVLIVIMAAAAATLDQRIVWDRLEISGQTSR